MNITKLERKKFRVRNKVKKVSSNERYRLSVNRSSKNISAQIIDDAKNLTLVSASSNTKEIKSQKKKQKRIIYIGSRNTCEKSKRLENYQSLLW